MKWIKGTDRIPKDGYDRFIRIEGTMSIGRWHSHHEMFINESGDFFPEDQVEWLDEEQSPADGWIPVEKQLPENDKLVLLANSFWRGVGKYDPWDEDEPKWQDETTEYVLPEPTHWQPLPPLPNKEG